MHLLDAEGPDGICIYAIGDVHGRLDLLRKMHETIAADRGEHPDRDWRVVHLGDYVDRGPDSKGVIDFLVSACEADERMIALAGNHDAAFLDFLATPSRDGLFANSGGRETALSYGVTLDFQDAERFGTGHEALGQAVPPAHLAFLRTLKRSVSFGDFFFCHAGIRPGVPLEEQNPEDLIWIRWDFLNHAGLHPKVVVHGHTPGTDVDVLANRINLDTGAFKTGRLSAVAIDGAEKQILAVAEGV